jgi:hypothetical protein
MPYPAPPDIHVVRAREVAQLLANAHKRGFLASKNLPANYVNDVELGFFPLQRVNPSPTPKS